MPIRRGGRTLTKRERKAETMKLSGWDEKTYNRKYDVLRNRTRNYEKATGVEPGSIDVGDLLYRNQRRVAMSKRYGEEYKPTALYAAISATPAGSTGRQISQRGIQRVKAAEEVRGNIQFSGILDNSKFSIELQKIKADMVEAGTYDPIEFNKVLEQYARRLQKEREDVAVFNKNTRDPFDYINWHS